MAIPRVSKMITDRQRKCEFVDWFVVNHRPALVKALAQLFQQDLEEGQPLPNVDLFLDGLVRRLRRALRELVEAEQTHLAEIADDGIHRDRRDEAARDLRDVVFNWRPVIRAVFGERKAEEAGFERRIADHPLALLRQTERLLARFRDPEFELDATRFDGVAVTRERIVEQLESPARQLRQAIDDVTSEQTKAHGTKVAKDQAMTHFDHVYRAFVNLFDPAFRLIGEDELAERLTLKLSRRSDPAEATEEPLDETSEAPDPGASGEQQP